MRRDTTMYPTTRAVFAIGFLVTLAAAVPAPAGEPLSAPAVASITVDGDAADWKGVPTVYLQEGPRVTAVAHDDRFLYVRFRFSDLELARRVLHQGAVVWFDAEGKHKEGYGLRYRGSEAAHAALREMEGGTNGPPQGPPAGSPPEGRAPTDEGRPGGTRRVPPGDLEVLRSGETAEVIAGGARENGPAAACAVSDGAFSFELRIPLADVAPTGGAAVGKGKRTLAVGFQIGGLTAADHQAMRERTGSGSHFGGGFGPGGGSGRGGGPPGGFDEPEGHFGGGPPGDEPGSGGPGGWMADVKPVWLDVVLADSSPDAGRSRP